MGLSSFKGQLAAAFTAAILAISPVQAATIAPGDATDQNITTTQFEVGQCYSQSDIEQYLVQTGETHIMDLDKVGTVNVRQNTPLGPQVVPRTFNNQYNLMADHDSWTLLGERPNGESCILMQGTDLDYVSIDNRFFTQVNDSSVPAASERESALENLQERYGETVFITGTTTSGQTLDITTSLRGGWSAALSNADGSNFKMALDGFSYSITAPDFHENFGIFHPSAALPNMNMVDVAPLSDDHTPTL